MPGHTTTKEGNMKGVSLTIAAVAVAAATSFGCATMGDQGWTTLIDGEKGLENFDRSGDVNWRAEGGAIVGDKGKGGFLVSKKDYKDFQLQVEFYAETTTNSGIFMRCATRAKLSDKICYEANIFDMRADQTYATGGIVHRGPVKMPTKAGGKWNTYDISMKGSELVVTLNGVETSRISSNELPWPGPIALQFGNRPPKGDPGGAIKWRKVRIREL
jgi:hypothetical protein